MTSWDNYAWPDWVPARVRQSIEDFWSESFGRGPVAWERYHKESAPGAFGEVRRIMTTIGDEPVSGRFVPLWNNMACVIQDDGTCVHGWYHEHVAGVRLVDEEEWRSEARRLFGDDPRQWRFRCPACGNEQCVGDDDSRQAWIYTACEGRVVEGRGCDWALGGFLKIHKVAVRAKDGTVVPVFEFAT